MPLYSGVGMLAKPSAWILDPAPSSFAPSNNWSNQDMGSSSCGKTYLDDLELRCMLTNRFTWIYCEVWL